MNRRSFFQRLAGILGIGCLRTDATPCTSSDEADQTEEKLRAWAGRPDPAGPIWRMLRFGTSDLKAQFGDPGPILELQPYGDDMLMATPGAVYRLFHCEDSREAALFGGGRPIIIEQVCILGKESEDGK